MNTMTNREESCGLYLLTLLALFFAEVESCPTECKCNEVSRSVDCSYTGLTHIPVRFIPEDTVILDLSHNQIQNVPADSFFSLSHLSIIRLDHNIIQRVDEHAFRGLNHVEFLSLRSNRLTTLLPNSFSGISGKRDVCFNNDNCRVDLTENDISEVGPNAFAWTKHISVTLGQGHADMKVKSYAFNGLKSVHKVHIYDIPSVEIEPRAFTNVEDVDILEISTTQVKTIQSFTFEGMKEIDKIVFSDCVVEGIKEYGFSGLSYRPDPDAMAYVDLNSTGTPAQELSGGELKLISCNISHLPTDMCRDTNLAKLTIEDNDIKGIKPNAFRGLHGLKLLQFTRNNIPELTEKSFGALRNVWEILIHGNNLTDINAGVFQDTHEIRRLSIGQSPDYILRLHSDAFSGLMDIEHFRLSGQASVEIAANAFNNMLGVHLFEITDTFIPVLREGAFRGLSRVNFMRLHGCGIARLEGGVFGLDAGRAAIREVDLTKGNALACGCDIAQLMQVKLHQQSITVLFPVRKQQLQNKQGME